MHHMPIETQLKNVIGEALAPLGIDASAITLERPGELAHGDFSTNVAMVYAKQLGKNPRALAEELVARMTASAHPLIQSIEIAGPGFINFRLSATYFDQALADALALGETYGTNDTLSGQKVVVEYTDPNPFKEFHIGHLMSNTIGESVSRLIEASGAETKRACYQGDVGLHVAKAMWGLLHAPTPIMQLSASELGSAYARGAQAYDDPAAKEEIITLNKKVYVAEDTEINALYAQGRATSLEAFEVLYRRLGTNHGDDGKAFNFYFFESKTGVFGKEVVLAHPEIFEHSDGAIVYKGDEAKGLHTRVFVNKEGLPTYEAKELGLAKIKHDTYPYDRSVVVTGNEVNDYFAVLLDAMANVFPELAAKTEHIGHGMLRLPTGKMSSRTGDVITAEALLDETKVKALGKITNETFTEEERSHVAEQVAIGAIKYAILRQASGKDIIFDFEQSLSFEGDSGPYLQYTLARTRSLLAKAAGRPADPLARKSDVPSLHKHLLRFPEVVKRAETERAPHHVATYLIELAREFNAFYGNTMILDGSADEPYKLALVSLVESTLARGLTLLGIPTPERM
jgi:arginyl-tRNA synthetase